MKLCHINFHTLISPKWFAKQKGILLSSVSIYNCPWVEAYRNSVCLRVTGHPTHGVFFPSRGNRGSNEYRTEILRQKAALGICSEFQFSCSNDLSINVCGTFNFVSCPAPCFKRITLCYTIYKMSLLKWSIFQQLLLQ